MTPLQISEPASLELAEAVRWHEARRSGWGGRLFDAVAGTFALIESFPEIGSPRRGRLPSRQLKVRGFPYIVAYQSDLKTSTSSPWLTRAGVQAIGSIVLDCVQTGFRDRVTP